MSMLGDLAASQSRLVWRSPQAEGLMGANWEAVQFLPGGEQGSPGTPVYPLQFAVMRTGLLLLRGWAMHTSGEPYTSPVMTFPEEARGDIRRRVLYIWTGVAVLNERIGIGRIEPNGELRTGSFDWDEFQSQHAFCFDTAISAPPGEVVQ